MTSINAINTIEDLARILREEPTWAEALRALLLSEDVLNLPARFDRFVEEQREFNAVVVQFIKEQQETNKELREANKEQRETNKELREINRLTNMRLNNIEGRLGNLDGGEYERRGRARALARSLTTFGFVGAYFALHQGGHTDPRFTSSLSQAIKRGDITPQRAGDLLESDIVISAVGNRHAVFEVSITADYDDIHRARARAEIMAQIVGGEVKPAIITANLSSPQREQAEAENVSVFVIPYH